MFQLTHQDLANLLIHLHSKRVNVRIITNRNCEHPGFDLMPKLQEAGIKVKVNNEKEGGLMHAKYAIIDGKVLIHGSANWTRHAFELNSETIVITRTRATIQQFNRRFEQLWSEYSMKPTS